MALDETRAVDGGLALVARLDAAREHAARDLARHDVAALQLRHQRVHCRVLLLVPAVCARPHFTVSSSRVRQSVTHSSKKP